MRLIDIDGVSVALYLDDYDPIACLHMLAVHARITHGRSPEWRWSIGP